MVCLRNMSADTLHKGDIDDDDMMMMMMMIIIIIIIIIIIAAAVKMNMKNPRGEFRASITANKI